MPVCIFDAQRRRNRLATLLLVGLMGAGGAWATAQDVTSSRKVIVVQPAAGPFGGFRIGGRTFFKSRRDSHSTLKFRPSKNIPKPPPLAPESEEKPKVSVSKSVKRPQTTSQPAPANPIRSQPPTRTTPSTGTSRNSGVSNNGWVARQAIDQDQPLRDPRSRTRTTPEKRAAAEREPETGPAAPEKKLVVPEADSKTTSDKLPEADSTTTSDKLPATDLTVPKTGERPATPAAKPAESAEVSRQQTASASPGPSLNAPSLNEPEASTAAQAKQDSKGETEAAEQKAAVAEKPEAKVTKATPKQQVETPRQSVKQPESRGPQVATNPYTGHASQYIGTEPRQIDRDFTGRPTRGVTPSGRVLRMKPGIERVLRYFYNRPEIADKRSNWGMMHSIMVYGVDTRVLSGRKSYSAIGWIAGNNICRGKRLLLDDEHGIKADSGIGLQGHQAQLLMVLALADVPLDYPLYAKDNKYSVRDLLNNEMAACESGQELTFTLIGLSHYLDTETSWVTPDGQRWDIVRLIREELSQPIVGSACGGTHRLMAFGHALRKRRTEGRPVTGQWARAEKFTEDFGSYAYQLQNRDGSMSSRWFEGRADDGDTDRKIQTTGHIVEWLLTVTPDAQLQNPRLVAAVAYLLSAMHRDLDHEWQIGPKGHALRSLAMFYERVYNSGSAWKTTGIAQSSSTLSR